VIVLDTHAWVWAVADPDRLSRRAREAIDGAEAILVSAISAWEVATLVRRGRLELDRPVEAWVAQALGRARVREGVVTAAIAVRAAALDGESFPGDHADRLLYATAQQQRAPLVTHDRALRAFDPLGTVW
jgi:PIN domain nuclease of toxin-antitoxin system